MPTVPNGRRTRPSLSLSLVGALIPATTGGVAHAATLELREGDALLGDADRSTWLGWARCTCDAALELTVDLSGLTSGTVVAVVVGKSCLTSDAELDDDCTVLARSTVGSKTSLVLDVGASTLADGCAGTETTRSIFAYVDPQDDDTFTAYASLSLGVDTERPTAPAKAALTPGEGLVEVAFAEGDEDDDDVLEYQVLAVRADGQPVSSSPPDAAFTSAYDLCAADGADALLAEAYVVSAASASTDSVTVTGLTNGVTYTFSVVAIDTFGNPSARTVLGDATPSAEEDFWERYKRSGGQAEGAGCSATGGAAPRSPSDVLAALLPLLLPLARAWPRRRRRRRGATPRARVRGTRVLLGGRRACLGATALASVVASPAQATTVRDEPAVRLTLGVSLALYRPEVDAELAGSGATPYGDVFGDGLGPMFGGELGLAVAASRDLTLTLTLGLSRFSADAKPFVDDGGDASPSSGDARSGGTTGLVAWPVLLRAGARLESLRTRLGVPLVPYAELGGAIARWSVSRGDGEDVASGSTAGLTIGGGLRLELLSLPGRSGRALRDELGATSVALVAGVEHLALDGLGAGGVLVLRDTTYRFGVTIDF